VRDWPFQDNATVWTANEPVYSRRDPDSAIVGHLVKGGSAGGLGINHLRTPNKKDLGIG
jgi:hypothetical protein